MQIPQKLGREMAKKRSDRGRKTSHVGREYNARSNKIPQRERQNEKDQGVLLPRKLRRTLLAWKSERQGGVHLEKMTTSPYTSPDKVGSHSSRVLYWSRRGMVRMRAYGRSLQAAVSGFAWMGGERIADGASCRGQAS